jgi:DNA-binding protein Fis
MTLKQDADGARGVLSRNLTQGRNHENRRCLSPVIRKGDIPMKSDNRFPDAATGGTSEQKDFGKRGETLNTRIGDSIDMLVEYLVDNKVKGIHPLIMGEVEKRLIVKVLERSRGNKLQAAKLLGMSRNTFHRKIQKMVESPELTNTEHDS